MTTQKDKIAALEARVDAIERKLSPPAPPKHHHRRITYTEPEPPKLEALTPDETAFLKARGVDASQRQITLNIQLQRMTKDEAERTKALVSSIKRKRGVSANWY